MNLNQTKYCLLTFDIEEWFQVENLKGTIKSEEWSNKKSSVVENTCNIIDLLSKYKINATFFILGWIAERYPGLIEKISDHGHEIACHGYGHNMTSELDDSNLEADILEATEILNNITGKRVRGYRAPNFTVDDRVITILNKYDFLYDSSYNPFQLHGRYGSTSSVMNQINFGILKADNGVYEIPVSTLSLPFCEFPMVGGAYFRIYPFSLYKRMVKLKMQTTGLFHFYLHPWELEPTQPRVQGLSYNHRLRHYYGLNRTHNKLEKLIIFLKNMDCKIVTISNLIHDMSDA
jgi:polysaccharide deacetylase family protein (PEP-CTERM system associated)